MKKDLLLLLLLLSFLTTELQMRADPWGKDADLALPQKDLSVKQPAKCATPLLGAFAELAIAFHQKVLSPADGPRSHFLPCSSQYTLRAMRKHGFFSGFLMGCDRLMRENDEPWVYKTYVLSDGKTIKLDPVP